MYSLKRIADTGLICYRVNWTKSWQQSGLVWSGRRQKCQQPQQLSTKRPPFLITNWIVDCPTALALIILSLSFLHPNHLLLLVRLFWNFFQLSSFKTFWKFIVRLLFRVRECGVSLHSVLFFFTSSSNLSWSHACVCVRFRLSWAKSGHCGSSQPKEKGQSGRLAADTTRTTIV